MDTKKKTILGIVVFALFIAIAYFGYQVLAPLYKPKAEAIPPSSATESQSAESKMLAPDFTVYDANGTEKKLSDFKGKPVVVNFWASWCPPCKEELPYFNEINAQMKDDVVFMMVDMTDGQRETQEKAQDYVEKQGYNFPVYFDTDQNAAYTYEISSIPTTLVLDKDGYITDAYQGAIDKDTLTQAIAKAKKA